MIASIGGAIRIGEHFGDDPVYIGNGDDRMDAFLLSGGLRYQFHGPTRPAP